MGFWSFFFIIVFLSLATQWYGTNKALKINSNIKDYPHYLPTMVPMHFYGLQS